MKLDRRKFLAGTAACALGGCVITNPAPTFEAGQDGSMPYPPELDSVGAQIKAHIMSESPSCRQ